MHLTTTVTLSTQMKGWGRWKELIWCYIQAPAEKRVLPVCDRWVMGQQQPPLLAHPWSNTMRPYWSDLTEMPFSLGLAWHTPLLKLTAPALSVFTHRRPHKHNKTEENNKSDALAEAVCGTQWGCSSASLLSEFGSSIFILTPNF